MFINADYEFNVATQEYEVNRYYLGPQTGDSVCQFDLKKYKVLIKTIYRLVYDIDHDAKTDELKHDSHCYSHDLGDELAHLLFPGVNLMPFMHSRLLTSLFSKSELDKMQAENEIQKSDVSDTKYSSVSNGLNPHWAQTVEQIAAEWFNDDVGDAQFVCDCLVFADLLQKVDNSYYTK